jgi:hypothetical protein
LTYENPDDFLYSSRIINLLILEMEEVQLGSEAAFASLLAEVVIQQG